MCQTTLLCLGGKELNFPKITGRYTEHREMLGKGK